MRKYAYGFLTAFLLSTQAGAQTFATPTGPIGSTAFCLFQLPADNEAPVRYLNLGIVQYVEVRANDIVIAYGGGNFGAGHEARIPVKTRDEALNWIGRMRLTAEDCAKRNR